MHSYYLKKLKWEVLHTFLSKKSTLSTRLTYKMKSVSVGRVQKL